MTSAENCQANISSKTIVRESERRGKREEEEDEEGRKAEKRKKKIEFFSKTGLYCGTEYQADGEGEGTLSDFFAQKNYAKTLRYCAVLFLGGKLSFVLVGSLLLAELNALAHPCEGTAPFYQRSPLSNF